MVNYISNQNLGKTITNAQNYINVNNSVFHPNHETQTGEIENICNRNIEYYNLYGN
jgi:hypothetical protein